MSDNSAFPKGPFDGKKSMGQQYCPSEKAKAPSLPEPPPPPPGEKINMLVLLLPLILAGLLVLIILAIRIGTL